MEFLRPPPDAASATGADVARVPEPVETAEEAP
jgi:hypothetical protein